MYPHRLLAIWAIVPVKPLKAAKSRLADVLSAEERATLSRVLLERTLDVLGRVDDLERILVISRDASVLHIARAHDAYTLTEPGMSDLNIALRRATEMAHAFNARAVLALPSDLPLLGVEDVRALIDAVPGSDPAVVLAPDQHEQGTNALFVRPPGLLQYQFGPGSMRAHLEQAARTGATVELCHRLGLQMDVDVPADLEALRALVGERIPEIG